MNELITIRKKDLQELIAEVSTKAIMQTIESLRNSEIIISKSERERYNTLEKESQVDKLLNGVQAAKVLSCSSAQITLLRNNGVIPSTCVGHRWYYPFSGLMRYLKSRSINISK